jgi:hypothetical protein
VIILTELLWHTSLSYIQNIEILLDITVTFQLY